MNIWLVIASILSALVCLLHIFGGGPTTVPDLIKRSKTRGEVGRFTAYYAWHLVTIVLAAQALAFWMAAQVNGARELAMFATYGALIFAVWSLAMIAIFRLKPMHYPQWLLFLPIGFIGLAGLYL